MAITIIDASDHDEIRQYYDLNPDLSILTYAGMLGLTGTELKDILMTDGSAIDKEEKKTAQLMFEEADETRTEYCNRMGFDM